MLNVNDEDVDQQISILEHKDEKPMQQISKLDLSNED